MNVVDLPIDQLREAPWNPNEMDQGMMARLRESLRRFGVVENLIVRPAANGHFEVIGGNHRFRVLMEAGYATVPCLVVELDDARARLLAQALNHIAGTDDLGPKAELLREVLTELPDEEVVGLLPETAESLRALASLREEDLVEHLKAWQRAQAARLIHRIFQLSPLQAEVVDEALERILPGADIDPSNPNRRGTALYQMCRAFLESEKEPIR